MTFKVVTEKKARKIIQQQSKVVFIHTKTTCPVCDKFLPEVLEPIFKKEKYRDINIYEIKEPLLFPVGSHPVTYFFRDGYCSQHPAGAAPPEVVENLLDTIFLGKLRPLVDIDTDKKLTLSKEL
tara:strand:- start:852 stop:1223 length:372 start_codon:yes stop_codon:yes gene_type:complete